MIAFRDIWRSRLRFGLLAAAVGLLFFLLLFVNTLSGALLDQFIGALTGNTSDLLVYDDESQATIPASRLAPDAVDRVAGVDGVAAAAPISVLTQDVVVDGESVDASLWGIQPDGPGAPAAVVEGELPGAGEILVDTSARDAGLELGATAIAGGVELTVSGIAENATFSVLPTLYMDRDTFGDVFSAVFPDAPPVDPINIVGVDVAADAELETVETAITGLDGLEAFDRQAAADATPGVSSIGQSFGLITGITFLIVVVVVGFFFQILTVQKLPSFTVLRALGATTRSMAGAVMTQIAVMVGLGVLVGALLLVGAVAGFQSIFSVAVDPVLVATFGIVILAASLFAGLSSVRRVARQDPAQAAFGGGR